MTKNPFRQVALAAIFVSTALTAPAMAADLVVPPPVEAPVVMSNNGFYLRGDLAYNFTASEDAVLTSGPLQTSPTTPVQTGAVTFDMEDALSLGAGVGYRINDNFRVDGTLSYLVNADASASFACDNTVVGTPGVQAGTVGCGVDGVTSDKVSAEVFTIMANAYGELGNFNGFTPYLGAGVGVAHVDYGTYSSDTTAVAADLTSTSPYRVDRGQDWRLAWALHAGTSYDLSDRLKLDVGYSFNRVEEASIAGGNAAGNDMSYIDDTGFDSHTIRAGLRYRFN